MNNKNLFHKSLYVSIMIVGLSVMGFPRILSQEINYKPAKTSVVLCEVLYELGKKYEQGSDGVEKDYELAVAYYKKAIDQGSVQAREALAEFYLTTSRDIFRYKKAVTYYIQAPKELKKKRMDA